MSLSGRVYVGGHGYSSDVNARGILPESSVDVIYSNNDLDNFEVCCFSEKIVPDLVEKIKSDLGL